MRAAAWKLSAATGLAIMIAGCAGNGVKHDPAEQQDSSEQRGMAAASREEFEAYCAGPLEPPCRRDVEFTLVLDESGKTETFRFDLMPPPLQENMFNLLPGETIYLTGEFIDGLLQNRRASYTRPEKPYLKFSFTQNEGEPAMMLAVINTFDTAVKYRLVMMPPTSEDLYKTSSCPVIANGGAFEMWPYAIFQLIVLETRAVELDGQMVCVW